jgi:hypothetical protein
VTTPFPCFLSAERVCSEAEQGLPCEIGRISQGREKAEKRVVGERRLEEGHSGAVPLHGSAVPLLTDRACTHSKPLTHLTYAGIISPGLNLNIPQGGDEHVDPIPQ